MHKVHDASRQLKPSAKLIGLLAMADKRKQSEPENRWI